MVHSSKSKKNDIYQKIASFLGIDDKSTLCLLLSAIFHIFFILILCLLWFPPSGNPDGDLMQVGFVSDQSNESHDKTETKEDKSYVPKVKDSDVDPEEKSSDELIDELKELKIEDDDGYEKYMKEWKEKIQRKKRREERLAKKGAKISKSLAKRSKYGTLKPRTFYGVKVFASSVVFLLDVSGSMNIREARIQIKNAYSALTSAEYFNIIVYETRVYGWKNHLVRATDQNKSDADTWVDNIRSTGATNIYGALEKAFQVAWQETKAEVIYLLTDGLPTAGPVVNPARILAEVKKWNQNKRIVIHTIGIGSHQDRKFLSALAEGNYGRYYVR